MRATIAREVTVPATCCTAARGVTAVIRLPARVVISRVVAGFVD